MSVYLLSFTKFLAFTLEGMGDVFLAVVPQCLGVPLGDALPPGARHSLLQAQSSHRHVTGHWAQGAGLYLCSVSRQLLNRNANAEVPVSFSDL